MKKHEGLRGLAPSRRAGSERGGGKGGGRGTTVDSGDGEGQQEESDRES